MRTSNKTKLGRSLEMISKAYEIYKKLGGNSFIEGLVKKVSHLEIVDDTF